MEKEKTAKVEAAKETAGKQGIGPAQVADLLAAAQKLIAAANATYQTVKLPCGSRALAFAVAAGFEPCMAYTIDQTMRYSGLDRKTLYREHEAGRLKFVLPKGAERGYRITVDEMDRWMEENAS